MTSRDPAEESATGLQLYEAVAIAVSLRKPVYSSYSYSCSYTVAVAAVAGGAPACRTMRRTQLANLRYPPRTVSLRCRPTERGRWAAQCQGLFACLLGLEALRATIEGQLRAELPRTAAAAPGHVRLGGRQRDAPRCARCVGAVLLDTCAASGGL